MFAKPLVLMLGLLLIGALSFAKSYHHVVTFKKGTSELTKSDKDALTGLMQSLKERSEKIEQVHIAAWADRAVDRSADKSPNKTSDKTSDKTKDRELAAKRMNSIQDYFEADLGQSYVETYNMAERSNWFAKAMESKAQDIKKMFAQKGAPQNVTPEDFAFVRTKGGPLRAVVLIELEPSTMAPAKK